MGLLKMSLPNEIHGNSPNTDFNPMCLYKVDLFKNTLLFGENGYMYMSD